MNGIGVGVVGCGFVGRGAHVPAFREIESAELVAIADPNDKIRDKVKRKHGVERLYADYRQLTEDPDIQLVVVSVPTPLHAEVARAAIEAGKHVLCEMPLAVTRPEARALADAAERAGVVLMPSLTFRFTPTFVKLKALIEGGSIGQPLAYSYREYIPAADLARQWPPDCWMWDFSKSGGPLFTLSVWSIDLMRWLTGSEIGHCHANRHYCRLDSLETLGYDASVTLAFESGATGSLQYSGSVPASAAECTLSVIGDASKVVRTWDHDRVELLGDDPTRTEWNVGHSGARMWGHFQQNQHLIDSLIAGEAPSITAADGLKAMEIAEIIAGTME